ncbi:hypothetical protein [Candidatus Endomicrobiellum devescovinae]|jgi:hypothetical protein|uniref:hypothetical protein n=1 Tax=Candidatus Endomicrobiellum devescovinae TaxID=3242322 RepID=UPI00283963B3|nr:hypothetical protein [Endomicrobium sp.]
MKTFLTKKYVTKLLLLYKKDYSYIISSRYIVNPFGLSSLEAAKQKPPIILLRSLPFKSIVYFVQFFVRSIGPIDAESESGNSPEMPPTLNSETLSPPTSPLAQKLSCLAPVKS